MADGVDVSLRRDGEFGLSEVVEAGLVLRPEPRSGTRFRFRRKFRKHFENFAAKTGPRYRRLQQLLRLLLGGFTTSFFFVADGWA